MITSSRRYARRALDKVTQRAVQIGSKQRRVRIGIEPDQALAEPGQGDDQRHLAACGVGQGPDTGPDPGIRQGKAEDVPDVFAGVLFRHVCRIGLFVLQACRRDGDGDAEYIQFFSSHGNNTSLFMEFRRIARTASPDMCSSGPPGSPDPRWRRR